ncbi:cation:proton antiporter [Leuconostoc koreense]|nr:cation:proton antiporter [Leuconostoc mesenteroides]QGM25394.1 cation:proton antiporter [Leuconostoc mesenteroides subsp. mesenteroides]
MINILLLITITLLFGKVAIKLGFAEVIGQLLAGIVIGMSFLNVVHSTSLVHMLSEIGIFILMLSSGLASDMKTMKKYVKASSLIAIMGVTVPVIVFPIVFILMGYSTSVSFFSGIVFSATSISITLAVLAEQKKLASVVGAIILSAAIIDDVISLVAVTLFSVFIGNGGFNISSLLPLLAFVIGIFLRKTSIADQIFENTNQIGQWIFYPIFFGSIGLNVTISQLNNKIVVIILFILLAIITKFIGAWIGAKMSGLKNTEAKAIGAGMISRGEMALVITQIGLSSQVINDTVSGEFILVIIFSTLIAPILMKPLFANI